MLARLALIVPALVLVAGCGGPSPVSGSTAGTSPTRAATHAPSSPPTVAESPTATASPTPTTGPSASSAPTGAPTTASGTTRDLSGQSFAAFTSPSGAIGCVLYDGPGASCQVQKAAWNVQKPASCDGAYGDAVELGRERARLSCHTDTDFVGNSSTQPALPYGTTALYRGLRCTSATTGVTCRNAAGHGFTIARTSYRLF